MKRKKHMRLPNGFGSIVFLTGNRRRPYWAKKFKYKDERGYPVYDTIGYYESYNDAYAALLEYNRDPYDFATRDMTFGEAADRWMKEFTEIPVDGVLPAKSTVASYRAAAQKCENITNRKIREITAQELQAIIATVSAGSQHHFKTFVSSVFNWAIRNNVVQDSPIRHVHRTAKTSPKRNPFTVEEVRKIWTMDPSPIRDTALILLYTGMRSGELLTISEQTDRYIVAGEKTDAGKNRIIPIHSRIRHLVENMPKWSNKDRIYANFIKMFPGHTPQDCRRTFTTRSLECGMDPIVSRKIVGHSGKDIHESAYIILKNIDYLSQQMELVEY